MVDIFIVAIWSFFFGICTGEFLCNLKWKENVKDYKSVEGKYKVIAYNDFFKNYPDSVINLDKES